MLRIEQDLLQLQLMTVLEIETPMFKKIERGDRCAKREKRRHLLYSRYNILRVTDVKKEGMKQLFIDYKEIKRIIGQGVDCCESSPQRNLPLKRNEKSTILP